MPRVYQATRALRWPQLCYLYLMVTSLQGVEVVTVETASKKRSKKLVLKTKGSSMHRIYIYIYVRYSHNRTDVFLWSSPMVNCLKGRLLLWKYIIQLSELSCTVWRWLRWCLMCIYRYRYMEVRWKREILGDCLPFIQSCSVAPPKNPTFSKGPGALEGSNGWQEKLLVLKPLGIH